jgi:hypothetical protein
MRRSRCPVLPVQGCRRARSRIGPLVHHRRARPGEQRPVPPGRFAAGHLRARHRPSRRRARVRGRAPDRGRAAASCARTWTASTSTAVWPSARTSVRASPSSCATAPSVRAPAAVAAFGTWPRSWTPRARALCWPTSASASFAWDRSSFADRPTSFRRWGGCSGGEREFTRARGARHRNECSSVGATIIHRPSATLRPPKAREQASAAGPREPPA